MRKYLLGLLLSVFFAGSASAAPWVSLGRMNGPVLMPNVQQCKHRVINHYWSSKPIFYPTTVNTYAPDNIEFVFNIDLRSLSNMTSNSPSNSRLKTAIDAYNARTGAKSIYSSVAVGQFPRVGINVSYADANGLVQGLGWSVVASELSFYELQELCPA